MMEDSLRQFLMLSQGDERVIYTHGLARNIFILSGVILPAPFVAERVKRAIRRKG